MKFHIADTTAGDWKYEGGEVVIEGIGTILKADRNNDAVPPYQRDRNIQLAGNARKMYFAIRKLLEIEQIIEENGSSDERQQALSKAKEKLKQAISFED